MFEVEGDIFGSPWLNTFQELPLGTAIAVWDDQRDLWINKETGETISLDPELFDGTLERILRKRERKPCVKKNFP